MRFALLAGMIVFTWSATGQQQQVHVDTLGYGWSRTSVNTVVFRRNSLTTLGETQYAAWYDSLGNVMVARKASDQWTVANTGLKGKVADAHNSISIVADGDGFLHMAWDHHNVPLHYVRSRESGSTELIKHEMIGTEEERVTYPEFHRLANGDVLFVYRNGESGKGNLVMNRYNLKTRSWTRLHSNLIDGEGQRNAYWQLFTDARGTIHLSWVWRESPDVASNHDLCYARSKDGGSTWERTDGTKYQLPVTASNAEYAKRIPMNSELINQTSMTATTDGFPVIATYWRDNASDVPQYFVVYHDGDQWLHQQVSQRTTDFSLKGGGTKKIPIARPQVMATGTRGKERLLLVLRDAERGNKVSIAESSGIFTGHQSWTIRDVTDADVGQWEPTYDTELWRTRHVLALFVQKTGQGDGEKAEDISPQPVVVLYLNVK